MHDMAGGGASNTGSADARGEVELPAGWKDLPAGDQQKLRSIGRTINEAQKRVRDNKIDPELLKKLGMTESEFGNFVEKYAKRYGKRKPDAAETEKPTDVVKNAFNLTGKAGRQGGKAAGEDVGVEGAEKLTKDEIRKLLESRASEVAPEYRKAVEEYYRAISEGDDQQPKDK